MIPGMTIRNNQINKLQMINQHKKNQHSKIQLIIMATKIKSSKSYKDKDQSFWKMKKSYNKSKTRQSNNEKN